MIRNALHPDKRKNSAGAAGASQGRKKNQKGSTVWIPFASYCTTGQFMKLRDGYQRHCGPTAAVNLIRTLDHRNAPEWVEDRQSGKRSGPESETHSPDSLFLLCADIGRRTRIYWNMEILGRFGGTSNFLTPLYLRSCLREAGFRPKKSLSIRFHPWITPDAVAAALDEGAIVYLQVYGHPKYKNHHMLCYAYRTEGGARQFLLADGWASGPVWVTGEGLGHGHYLTVRMTADRTH